jgi:hypothetical protein
MVGTALANDPEPKDDECSFAVDPSGKILSTGGKQQEADVIRRFRQEQYRSSPEADSNPTPSRPFAFYGVTA